MARTSHGHHIPGTILEGFDPESAERCGGVQICPRCQAEVEEHIAYMTGENVNYPERAIEILRKHLTENHEIGIGLGDIRRDGRNVPPFAIYVIWFAKTLQNWKAILGTTLEDSMLYELTHNGDKRETYLDAYHKVENRAIPD